MSVPEVTTVGRVGALFRYPVKSMAGESVPRATIDVEGMRGDRQWAVVERGERGQILSAKRAPALMQCQAWYPEPAEGHDAQAHEPSIGAVRVRVAGSTDSLAGDDPALRSALGAAIGRDVDLLPRRPADDLAYYRHAGRIGSGQVRTMLGLEPGQPFPDISTLPLEKLIATNAFVTVPGTYFDLYPLHLMTTAALARIGQILPEGAPDVRRFRPNLLIETDSTPAPDDFPEHAWTGGGVLAIGEHGLRIGVEIRTLRCSMVMRAQPELAADRALLRAVAQHADSHLGVYAGVLQPGVVQVGDTVRFERPTVTRSRRLGQRLADLTKRSLLRVVRSTVYRG